MTLESPAESSKRELPPKLYMAAAVAPLVLAGLALLGLLVYHWTK